MVGSSTEKRIRRVRTYSRPTPLLMLVREVLDAPGTWSQPTDGPTPDRPGIATLRGLPHASVRKQLFLRGSRQIVGGADRVISRRTIKGNAAANTEKLEKRAFGRA
jgi:hypothetical protein